MTRSSLKGKSSRHLGPEEYYSAALACYLAHVEGRQTIRSIASQANLHPSTIMRRIRKIEGMRDDPLVDQYLASVWGQKNSQIQSLKGPGIMTSKNRKFDQDGTIQTLREEKRILRRLCETGAFLAVPKGLAKAVVLRQTAKAGQTRTAVVEASVVAALVVKDWLRCSRPGRISCYEVTPAGRAALKRKLAAEAGKTATPTGFSEAPSVFSEQHKEWGERVVSESDSKKPRRIRVNLRGKPYGIHTSFFGWQFNGYLIQCIELTFKDWTDELQFWRFRRPAP